ncbi:IS30 family transposase [Castellaniella caeni]
MGIQYSHLSPEERAVIQVGMSEHMSLRAIASSLGRCPSSISRELARSRVSGTATYSARSAGMAYRARRKHSVRHTKMTPGSWLYDYVRSRLVDWCWSPQQIAAKLHKMHPNDASRQISHETIYAAIYAHPRGALKKALIEALRQAKPTRGRRRTTAARQSFVPEELRIVHRPEAVATRLVPGHWEGDLIKGAFNRSAVGTLVERKTRFVVLCRMDGCTATDALEGFTRQMRLLPAFLRQSLTYDRGTEMTRYDELARRLHLDIWFADPHAPWQRGSNENTNGLLRQFMPKGIDLSDISQTYLNDVARLMNKRPRMTLGWLTPEEALSIEIANHSKCCT